MKEAEDESEFDSPPFFNSWTTIYLVVIGNLGFMILLFYIFSISFK